MCPPRDARKITALLFQGIEEQFCLSISRGMYYFKDGGKRHVCFVAQNCNAEYYCFKSGSVDGCPLFFRICPL